jgi:hypothetical protein
LVFCFCFSVFMFVVVVFNFGGKCDTHSWQLRVAKMIYSVLLCTVCSFKKKKTRIRNL